MSLTTDAEKRLLRKRAEAMEANHIRRGDRDYGIDNTAKSIHNRYVGLYGEWETAKQLGLNPAEVVDLSVRSGGDGRLGDFPVRLGCKDGPRRFWIDTKANQYTGPNEMLRVPHRQMPSREIAYQTIYVAVRYDKTTDDALPVGWEWGTTLIKENRVQTFGSRGVKNYVKPYGELRDFSELTSRVLPCGVTAIGGWH